VRKNEKLERANTALSQAEEKARVDQAAILKAQAEHTGLPAEFSRNAKSNIDEVRDLRQRLIKLEGRAPGMGAIGGGLDQIAANLRDHAVLSRKSELERANTNLDKAREKVNMDEATILKAQAEHTGLSQAFLRKMEANTKEVQDMQQRLLKLEGRTPRI
jgi:hypothetical protein